MVSLLRPIQVEQGDERRWFGFDILPPLGLPLGCIHEVPVTQRLHREAYKEMDMLRQHSIRESEKAAMHLALFGYHGVVCEQLDEQVQCIWLLP